MTPRSIRRAAERRANKLARNAAQQAPQVNPAPRVNIDIVENPAAAGVSAEPVLLPAAEANAHIGVVTSALTGHAALLPAADAAQYDQLLHDYRNEFRPVGLLESDLVQTLAETAWRARRTLALEMALFAKGRVEFAGQFAEYNSDIRSSQIDLHTFLIYEKQIRSLQLQESRLSRRAEKASAELSRLQQERHQREKADHQRQLEAAAQLYLASQRNHQTFDPRENGFEFSNQEIECYLTQKQAAKDRFTATLGLSMRHAAA
jgi:hypothetical protein